MSLAATLSDPLIIEQGATFDETFEWRDEDGDIVDLGGYDVRAQVRYSPASGDTLLTGEWDTSTGTATGTIEIEVAPVLGMIQLVISATNTAALDFTTAWFDLEVEDASGVVTRLVQGRVILDKEVTR